MANRREFLKHTTASGMALAAPFVLGTPVFGQEQSALRIGAIGVGGSRGRYKQGTAVAKAASNFGQMVSVCDVDDLHCREFNAEFDNKLTMYRDYREMLDKEKPDVVTIGTPDHWHVAIALAALEAGCDVYCEKPLTLTIDEGKVIREAVARSGKVFQVGTQQRSDHRRNFLRAAAIVQSGRLGKNVNAYLSLGSGETGGPFETVAKPDELDWNMWLGPTPKEAYSPQRQSKFRWYFNYSGGKMTDWGAHHIDIAQWAMGLSDTGPIKVAGSGTFPEGIVPESFDWLGYLNGETELPNGFNTAVDYEIDMQYANDAVIHVSNHYRREDGTEFDNGILFEGEDGRMFVNRGRLSGKPVEDLTDADNKEIEEKMVELYKDKQPSRRGGHMRNFFDCIADRGEPVSDVSSHHRTMTCCHLCNITLMLGRELHWDPVAERFVNDPEADRYLSRRRREGFELA